MRALLLSCVLLIAGPIALTQHRVAKPATAQKGGAAQFSSVEFHNADVTVRTLDLPAGASEPVGDDVHDCLLISYGTNALRITGYQTDFELKFADGDVQLVQGGWPHQLQNESDHSAQLLMVEVERNLFPKSARCGLGAKNCAATRYGQSGAGQYRQSLLFETDTANLFRVQLDAQVAMHQHDDERPHLLIALSPFQGHADDDRFTLQPRATYWHLGSIHEIGNDGSAQARFLILELKKKY